MYRRRNEEDAEQMPRPIRILPCPCGSDAMWYFEPQTPLAPDTDRPPNLCSECFALAVPEDDRDDWRRVPPPNDF